MLVRPSRRFERWSTTTFLDRSKFSIFLWSSFLFPILARDSSSRRIWLSNVGRLLYMDVHVYKASRKWNGIEAKSPYSLRNIAYCRFESMSTVRRNSISVDFVANPIIRLNLRGIPWCGKVSTLRHYSIRCERWRFFKMSRIDSRMKLARARMSLIFQAEK